MKKIIICMLAAFSFLSVFAVKVGDTLVLEENTARFATGERIKKDCLGKSYTVQQIGTQKHPNGILLKEICSWVECTAVGVSVQELQDSKRAMNQESKTLLTDKPTTKPDTIVKIVTDTITKVVTDTITKEVKETVVQLQSDTIIKVVKDTLVIRDTVTIEQSTNEIVKQDSISDAEKPFNRLSLGLRGGVASYMPSAENLAWNIGYQGVFDVQYAHYFKRKTENNPYCGVLTGVSVSYVSSSVSGSVNDAYSVMDTEGDQIDYTITAEQVKSSMSELQLQVPLMFSLLYKGLYFNIGPRFVVPVYTQGHQTLENAHITAYYAPYGVTLTDAVITGKLSEEQLDAGVSWDSPVFQINASAEIGYEFTLKNGDSFGIGVYADYGIYNLYKNNASAQSMISISQVGADPLYPAPIVEVLPLVSSYVSKLGYFDAGIKLVYHFNVK